MEKRTRKLLRENNKSEKGLPKDASEILTDIVVYLRSSNLSMYNQELIRRDITQMLIEGDERGEFAKDVIGEDYEVFCDMLIAALPEPTAKEKRLAVIYQAITSTWFLLLCWLGVYCASLIGDGGKWNGQVDFSLNSEFDDKVDIKAGETKTIDFTITTDMLKFYDVNMNYVAEPGEFKVYVGRDSKASLCESFRL